MNLPLPQRIGRFRVVGLLGQGAMGVVYRGRDDALERDVALKVMSAAALSGAENRERFLREARASARLQHPNIITIYELGEHDGQPFMALELLEGLDLQRAIEAGVRPDAGVVGSVVLQVLAGLGHAHAQGVIHRDVKPSNIFIPSARPVKIMDFGVARLATATLTTTGTVLGTPSYMSPEQVRAGEVDGRSDLFSVGLILYELLTGGKAFEAGSVVAVLYKIAHESPDLSLLRRGAGWDGLREVIERALARDPAARYPDAAAMTRDLVAALEALGATPEWALAPELTALLGPARPQPAANDTWRAQPTLAATGEETELVEPRDAEASRATAPPATPPDLPLATGRDDERTRVAFEDRPGVTRAALSDAVGLEAPRRRSSAGRRLAVWGALAGVALALALGVRHLRTPAEGPPPATPSPAPAVSAAPTAPATPLPSLVASPPPVATPAATPAPPTDTTTPRPAEDQGVQRAATPRPEPTPAKASGETRRMVPESASQAQASPAPAEETAGVAAPETPAATAEETLDERAARAERLLDQRRYASALAEAKAVLAQDPRHALAREIAQDAEALALVETSLQQAREAWKNGDREATLAELRRGLAVRPNDARLLALWREATE